jgi:deoxyinosine 3'endonuclease (endonuclease V)
VGPGTHPSHSVFVGVDVHYLASGGARAAAVVAADAAVSRLAADRIALMPDAEPCQPGRFFRRELPSLRAVLGGLDEMACSSSTATPAWTRADGPAWAPAPARSPASR